VATEKLEAETEEKTNKAQPRKSKNILHKKEQDSYTTTEVTTLPPSLI
jgi:hypothetical protein